MGKLKMDKSSYKSAEGGQEKEKSNRNTGGTQVLRFQWDDVAKKYTDTVTGYKYTFTFDGAEKDVLVVKFTQTNRTLSNGTWLHSKNMKSSRIENAAYFRARKEVRSMDRPEICEVAGHAIDNVLGAENSCSYTNTFKSGRS